MGGSFSSKTIAITTIQILSGASFPSNLARVFILSRSSPDSPPAPPVPSQARGGAGMTEVGGTFLPPFPASGSHRRCWRDLPFVFQCRLRFDRPVSFPVSFGIQAISWLLFLPLRWVCGSRTIRCSLGLRSSSVTEQPAFAGSPDLLWRLCRQLRDGRELTSDGSSPKGDSASWLITQRSWTAESCLQTYFQ